VSAARVFFIPSPSADPLEYVHLKAPQPGTFRAKDQSGFSLFFRKTAGQKGKNMLP
jgi:hypothetical protein